MHHALTIYLPDSLFKEVQRIARATGRAMEDILVCAATTRLPTSKGLPEEVADELASLELLNAVSLQEVMRSEMPPPLERRLCELLIQQQASSVEADTPPELEMLLNAADRLLLRKARAALLLRLQGDAVPSLKELSESFSFTSTR